MAGTVKVQAAQRKTCAGMYLGEHAMAQHLQALQLRAQALHQVLAEKKLLQ